MTRLSTALSDNARQWDAESGSRRLYDATRNANQWPDESEHRPLTHAEQIAAVESGRARIVTVRRIRKADPEMTLGGVTDW
jgi:hypothetical protein